MFSSKAFQCCTVLISWAYLHLRNLHQYKPAFRNTNLTYSMQGAFIVLFSSGSEKMHPAHCCSLLTTVLLLSLALTHSPVVVQLFPDSQLWVSFQDPKEQPGSVLLPLAQLLSPPCLSSSSSLFSPPSFLSRSL